MANNYSKFFNPADLYSMPELTCPEAIKRANEELLKGGVRVELPTSLPIMVDDDDIWGNDFNDAWRANCLNGGEIASYDKLREKKE